MKQISFLILTLIFCSCLKKYKYIETTITGKGIENAEKQGIKFALHTSSLNHLSLIEIFKEAPKVKIKYIEVEPNHRIGDKWQDKTFNYNLTKEDSDKIKEIAKSYEVQIVGMGTIPVTDSTEWDRLQEFSKNMELEYITSFPNTLNFSIQKTIKVGIENDTTHTNFYHPDSLLSYINHNSQSIMNVNPKITNWYAKGIDHIEALDKLKGRIFAVYLSDIDAINEKPCGWGNGVLDIDGVMLALKKQQFKGFVVLKQDLGEDNALEELRGKVYYYDAINLYIFKEKDNKAAIFIQ